jgi:hypothetical protein
MLLLVVEYAAVFVDMVTWNLAPKVVVGSCENFDPHLRSDQSTFVRGNVVLGWADDVIIFADLPRLLDSPDASQFT